MELDFFKAKVREIIRNRKTMYEIYPEFLTRPSKDLMTRGGKFYAVYDPASGFWTSDEFKIQEFVDEELRKLRDGKVKEDHGQVAAETLTVLKDMMRFNSKSWIEYKNYVNSLPDHYKQLDDRLWFSGEVPKREDYISKCLPYPLKQGSYEAWDKIVSTLYKPEERQKIEWAIGSIIAGDSKSIQKFLVFYGNPGSGKGTILTIIQKLFPGYYETFDAKSLSSNTNNFAFEQFRSNPLVALQMDGDLSRIEDNTKINSLVSHETIVMNEKRKQSYNFTPKCFLFMASNKPVQITDSKSGLLRRLIDVNPSGETIPKKEYDRLMNQIDFELSGIAWHCLEVYKEMGKNYYNGYTPLDMMERTNDMYNFVLEKYDVFSECLNNEGGFSLDFAYNELWQDYYSKAGLKFDIPRRRFKEELKDYFTEFVDIKKVNGRTVRSWYCGAFDKKKFKGSKDTKTESKEDISYIFKLNKTKSLLDEMLKECQAQYAEDDGHGGSKPIVPWSKCTTSLSDIDTKKLHFVRVPKNHIVIDFDLKNAKGEKDKAMNLAAAEKWPKTYAEYSQGGNGVHLHYIYDGDVEKLSGTYDKDIEIKVFSGKSSLRRRLTFCNDIPVSTLSGGLPLKDEGRDAMIDFESVKDESHVRNIIGKCLRKEIAQPYTAPAMSLIKKTLEDAYKAGIKYDVHDMRPAICAFAAKSSHQKDICMKMANELYYFSKHFDEEHKWDGSAAEKDIQKPKNNFESPADVVDHEARSIGKYTSEELVFFDIEVFPNLFLVNWKEAGEGKGVVRMINPTRAEINDLLHRKLIGFNCRRYDNHILYARLIGYDNDALYRLSQRIIAGSKNAMFGNAYDISYTDVYDFAAKKQSLKKWEIELGIHHQELGLPWDQPVPEERWPEVAAYCDNDVIATEAVFNKLAGDFKAREILADIAEMTVNDTTNQLTTRIIFGDDPSPQKQFNYPDLKKKFPGYVYENGKSTLHGIEVGEGGRVFAVPGIWYHTVTFDVASMHPSSIIAENGFGKYTEKFKQLMDIRVAIKHKDFETAKKMMDGKLAKYLDDPTQAKALSKALKIAINSVYGLTAAGFDNKFRDPRNIDNWVAKRGALFMETLRLKVSKMGGTVVHIKTDSIKVQEPSAEISQFILDYGKQYGYTFEIENKYEKICLVNDAVYIALREKDDPEWLDECEKAKKKAEAEKKPYIEPTRWTATGAQFQHPYVFKKLFSHEEIEFSDLCETKTVTSALYLDMNEKLSDVSEEEKELDKLQKRVKALKKAAGGYDTLESWKEVYQFSRQVISSGRYDMPVSLEDAEKIYAEIEDLEKDQEVLKEIISKGHNYVFVGRAGSFCPVKAGMGGGILVREKDQKYSAATGSKGFRWREGETLEGAGRMDMIDMNYFEHLADVAKEAIGEYGDFEKFANETPEMISIDEMLKKSDAYFSKSSEATPPW